MLNLAHKNLEVYKITLLLVKEVYLITKSYPKEELYVLVSQVRRAAISVCSNIAEGSARSSKLERKRFYEISRSSLVEIETQIEISVLLEYTDHKKTIELNKSMESIFKMLSKLISNLSA